MHQSPQSAVIVSASLLIATGVASAAGTLLSGFNHIDFGFIFLPAYFGLLTGNRQARQTVLFLSGFILLLIVIFIPVLAYRELFAVSNKATKFVIEPETSDWTLRKFSQFVIATGSSYLHLSQSNAKRRAGVV